MANPEPELFERDRLVELVDRLRSFVERQGQALRDQYQNWWKEPIPKRVEKGRCITALKLLQIRKGIATFECTSNDSYFREGDRVSLSTGDPNQGLAGGEYYREEGKFIEVLLDFEWTPPDQHQVFTLDQSYIDLEEQYRRCIDRLGETEVGRTRILPLLAGDLESMLDFEECEQIEQGSLERGLNTSQAEAIAAASSTDLCALIQGPPGTGKTHVLAEVVRNRIAKKERILVTSFTHRAIHNALNKIKQLCPQDTDICKVGRPVFDESLKVQHYEYFSQAPFADSGNPYVIGATPFTAQSRRLSVVGFDTVIFDEAGQITLPLAIMGMLSGKTYIFVGDDKQLPPVLPDSLKDEPEGRSIFSFLRGRGFEQMLNVTYRMNKEITSWPSEKFYWGDLISHEKAADRRIHYPSTGSKHMDILDPNDPVVFVEMPLGEDKSRSLEEAILVEELLHELLIVRDMRSSDIGVVVPFRKQARAIKQRLAAKRPLEMACSDLVVDTVERMQGQERELIIVSMTASDPLFIHQVGDFLFQQNRLNVCFTRPKTKLVVLGSKTLLDSGHFEDEEIREGRALFRSFVSQAKHLTYR